MDIAVFGIGLVVIFLPLVLPPLIAFYISYAINSLIDKLTHFQRQVPAQATAQNLQDYTVQDSSSVDQIIHITTVTTILTSIIVSVIIVLTYTDRINIPLWLWYITAILAILISAIITILHTISTVKRALFKPIFTLLTIVSITSVVGILIAIINNAYTANYGSFGSYGSILFSVFCALGQAILTLIYLIVSRINQIHALIAKKLAQMPCTEYLVSESIYLGTRVEAIAAIILLEYLTYVFDSMACLLYVIYMATIAITQLYLVSKVKHANDEPLTSTPYNRAALAAAVDGIYLMILPFIHFIAIAPFVTSIILSRRALRANPNDQLAKFTLRATLFCGAINIINIIVDAIYLIITFSPLK